MKQYIKSIQINNLYHLHNIHIPIADENSPHLILTGKNGSGKTILLNAIAEHLDIIKSDTNLSFLDLEKELADDKKRVLAGTNSERQHMQYVKWLENTQNKFDKLYGKISIDFNNVSEIIKNYNSDNFIISFYEAARKTPISEPKNPIKPNLEYKGNVKNTLTSQLLNFLSDLKIQEALARNENHIEDANHIKNWFDRFESILRDFFEDDNLKLEFNYKDYSFKIHTNGKSFKFTELSDGFIAILDIVADLIMKMQKADTLVAEFNKPGIALIDEIETHLHLKLQKVILPMLTVLFPNIQFIVTTHSPFVLSSLNNTTAFDLERQQPIVDLTDYSYQALTEGYFGVTTDSDYARQRLNELEKLLQKKDLTDSERITAIQILEDYKKIPEANSPELVGAYRHLIIKYNDKVKLFAI